MAKDATTRDMQRMIEVLESMLKHRRANPTGKSDEFYYEGLIKYFQRIVQAREEGAPVIAHTVMIPTEIIYAMELTPMHLECTSNMMTILFKPICGTVQPQVSACRQRSVPPIGSLRPVTYRTLCPKWML